MNNIWIVNLDSCNFNDVDLFLSKNKVGFVIFLTKNKSKVENCLYNNITLKVSRDDLFIFKSVYSLDLQREYIL